MNRRSFIGAILAAGIAPAIARADWLMKGSGIIVPRPRPYPWQVDIMNSLYDDISFDVIKTSQLILVTPKNRNHIATVEPKVDSHHQIIRLWDRAGNQVCKETLVPDYFEGSFRMDLK